MIAIAKAETRREWYDKLNRKDDVNEVYTIVKSDIDNNKYVSDKRKEMETY